MDHAARRGDRLDVETLLESLQTVPEPLPTPEEDRHDGDVHLVDQIRLQELADRRGAAADAHVQVTGELTGACQRLGGLGVDEVEHVAAFELQRRTHVVREHEAAITERVYAAVAVCGGSISAEHGIGLKKKPAYARHADPVRQDLARALKGLLDPKGLFNPGKVV